MDILTSKIIEKVYGKSIERYKDYLKQDLERVISLLEGQIATIREREDKKKTNPRVIFTFFEEYPDAENNLLLYQGFLRNLHDISIADIDIDFFALLDFKVKKVHNAFINKLTDEIANKLIKGESII